MTVELICGDCLEVMKSIPDKSIDAVITDPPYVFKNAHNGGGFAAAREFYHGGKIDFISDFDFTAYADILFSAPILVACCSRDLIKDYANEAEKRGYTFDLHVWFKVNAIPFTHNTFKSDLEYIIVAWKGSKKMAKLPQDEMSKVYQSGIMNGKQHPTEKPIALMTKYINVFCEANTILDPFMGSGTTGVACVQTGRNFIGIEIDEGYFKIAEKRIHDAQQQMRLF